MIIISTDKAPAAIGPYSQAVRSGDFLFCSGQIGLNPSTGKLAGDDIKTQTVQVLKNIRGILEAEGLAFGNVVKTTVFILRMADFPVVNEIYGREFGGHKPARATVQVAGLPMGALIEIDCVAEAGK